MSHPEHNLEATFPSLDAALKLKASNRTRLPFVVEFSGLPKSGKTTTIRRTVRLLRKLGWECETIREAATETIDKSLRQDLFLFNVLCAIENISQIVQLIQQRDTIDIIIIDRGLFDNLAWMAFVAHIGQLPPEFREPITRFIQMPPWLDCTKLIVFLDSDYTSYERRHAIDSPILDNPHINRYRFGILRNKYHELLRKLTDELDPKIVKFDCSLLPPVPADTPQLTELVANWHQATNNSIKIVQTILDSIVSLKVEFIATIPSDVMRPEVAASLSEDDMSDFINDVFGRSGAGIRRNSPTRGTTSRVAYVERSVAEVDPKLLQLVGAAFIRWDDKYLVLMRSDREKREQLRGKRTLIISGHVESADRRMRWGGRNEVETCLLRELREELRSFDRPSLMPRFAFRIGDDEMGRRHLGLVYEIRMLSSTISIAGVPGAGEFEKKVEYWDVEKLLMHQSEFDDWSRYIIGRLAAETRGPPTSSSAGSDGK